jgi:outer membrane receptor protein involved in Fe transport
VQNFLANKPSQVSFDGTLSDPSPFFNGASGVPEGKQGFYGAYIQDEWRIRPNLTMSYGLRYDYFAPLIEVHGREVNVNTVTGALAARGSSQSFSNRETRACYLNCAESEWHVNFA